MGSRTSMVLQKNTTNINIARSRLSIDFSCNVSKIQNTSHSHVLAHGKSYEHGFTKKHDCHQVCTKSHVNRVLIDFLCTVSEIQNIGHSQRISRWEVVRARHCKKMRWS
ncbi:hypothetical protein GW17_00062382 [Ensete ventricosum]|nr:hypothetical protein GW17_00062382 [Ensete ventricosum]